MKNFFKKFSLLALFSIFSMFLFSCYGSTSINVKDQHRRGSVHHHQSYPRYDVRYESHPRVPSGHHKKKHKPKYKKQHHKRRF